MSLRLLCDENIPASLVSALRDAGHDVLAVGATASGMADVAVLAWAQREARTCVTFDADFGELAIKRGRTAGYGIILLRLPIGPHGRGQAVIVQRIGEREDWAGHLAVLEPHRTRLRRLAPS